AAAAQSELVQAIASLRRDGGRVLALGNLPLRPLYRDEIEKLESQGNSSADWSRIRAADWFDWRKVWHSNFYGEVLLGRFTRSVRLAEGLELPTGIYQATLSHCIVGNDVLIRDVKLLANSVILEGAVLFDCGSITCEARTSFG